MNWFENSIVTSVLIPVVVAALTAWITNFLNRDRNKVEIEKLKEETASLKKSFQPVVVGMLQSTQEKVISTKIEALVKLVKLRNEFNFYEDQDNGGVPYVPGQTEFLLLLFWKFNSTMYESYLRFHDEYSYIFPDDVFQILNILKDKLMDLDIELREIDAIKNDEKMKFANDESLEKVKSIVSYYQEAILAIRKDCHLDTSFIHDFIEQNKST